MKATKNIQRLKKEKVKCYKNDHNLWQTNKILNILTCSQNTMSFVNFL